MCLHMCMRVCICVCVCASIFECVRILDSRKKAKEYIGQNVAMKNIMVLVLVRISHKIVSIDYSRNYYSLLSLANILIIIYRSIGCYKNSRMIASLLTGNE